MDTWFQDKLDELERAGQKENTIVFFFSPLRTLSIRRIERQITVNGYQNSKVSVIRFPPNGLFGVSYFRAWRVLDQFCDQFATVGDFHRATAEASEGGF